MKNQVLLLNTGYSLRGLMQSNPNVAAQFALLGIDFDEERQVSSRQQLIEQVSRSVQDCQLLLLVDHDPQLRAREILAQGFRKPLHRDEQAAQQLASRGQAETAMIPQDAVALTDPGCSQAGFVLFFPSVCVALIPGSAAEALRMLANQLFPVLLTHSFPGAVTVDVPLRSDRIEEVQDYLERVRRRNRAFLPLLGGTTSNPVLRLIAAQDSQKRSRQCCDSFLEDLVSECGNVTTVSRVGVRGIRALERKKQPSQAEFLNRASAPPRTNSADLYAAPPRTNTADPYAALSEQLYEPDDLYDDDEDEDEPQEEPQRPSSRREKSERIARRQQEEEPARRRSPVITLLLTVCVCVFLGSVGYLGHYYWKSAQNRTAYETLREVYDHHTLVAPSGYPQGYDRDFAGLWEINPDVVGWLSIADTALDYPVVQTTDNTKYYRTNFEGQYSEHAVPFVDAAVDLKRPSDNVVIYGHNIRTDGQMFNILKGYKELAYYQEHPVVRFDSVYHQGEYKIISVFYANTLSQHGTVFPYHEFIDAQSTQEKQDYIDSVLVRSIINTGVDVKPSDELLTLSTCSYEFKDARYVVVARKVRFGESAAVDTSGAAMNPTPLYPDIWYQLFGGTKPDEQQLKAALHS